MRLLQGENCILKESIAFTQWELESIQADEHELPDDYPIHGFYMYVARVGSKFVAFKSNLMETTAGNIKRYGVDAVYKFSFDRPKK